MRAAESRPAQRRRAAGGSAPEPGGARRRLRLDRPARGSARWRARAAPPGERGRIRSARPGGPAGARSATWREKRGRHEAVAVAPDEQGGRREPGEPGPQPALAVRARRGRCCARRRRRRSAPSATGRCGRTRRRRCRRPPGRGAPGARTGPELLADPRGAQRVRDRRELGPQQLHQRDQLAAAPEGQRRGQQAEVCDPVGLGERELDRDPAAHRVADQVGSLDPHRVHVAEHGAGEVGGVVGARAPASTRSRSPAGRSRGPCGPGSGPRPSRRRRSCSTPSRAGRSPARARRRRSGSRSSRRAISTSVHPQQRRTAAGEPEEPLEAERQVEVAARVEAALGERVEPGQPPLSQAEPGGGVGADDHVGLAHAGRPHVAALAARSHLPGPPDVPEADLEGGVEAGLGAQVAAGSEAKASSTRRTRCAWSETRCPCGRRRTLTRAVGRARPSDAVAHAPRIPANSINEPMRAGPDQGHAERRAAAARAARAGSGRHLRLRADRLLAHPRRQRAALRDLHAAAPLPRATRATSRGWSSTSPTSTTRSTRRRARPGVPSDRVRRAR